MRAHAFASLLEEFLLHRDLAVELFPRRPGDIDLDPSGCRLCVINLGPDKLVSVEARVQVGVAASLFANVPMMLLAADADERDLALANELSVDALVPLESGVDVLASALGAVLDGGGYMPAVPSRPAARQRFEPARPPVAAADVLPCGRDVVRPAARRRPGTAVGDGGLPHHQPPRLEMPETASLSRAPAPAAPRLTDRQTAVLAELQSGKSNKEIARTLDLAEATVKIHVRELMRKLNVNNRTQLAIIALGGGSSPNVRITDGSDLRSAGFGGSGGAYEFHLSGPRDTRLPLKWMP